MQQDILINWSPQETRVAIVENGAVQELHIERTLERGLVGNVYLGKVSRVLPGMQSAFIEIGLERTAFLHVADMAIATHSPTASQTAVNQLPPIETQLFDGQTVLVQVIKGTALASVVGFVELTKAGGMIANVTYAPLLVYSCVALTYFALCFPISLYPRVLDRNLHVRTR